MIENRSGSIAPMRALLIVGFLASSACTEKTRNSVPQTRNAQPPDALYVTSPVSSTALRMLASPYPKVVPSIVAAAQPERTLRVLAISLQAARQMAGPLSPLPAR